MRPLLRRGGLVVACLALCAALVLPRMARERALPNIIAIVDITQSMNVLDATLDGQSVSRLVFAKSALRRAVEGLPCGSRLGLGIFTEYRSVVLMLPVETCLNRRELLDAIDGLDGRMAWAGGSEIDKGVYLTLRMLDALDAPPAIAFITDGHEAPPIDPRHRIELGGAAGHIRGVIVGVGGAAPAPIPRIDPEGNPAGFWGPGDVMQESLYAHGRQGSVANEMMGEEAGSSAPIPPALQGTPGQEHLSFLHESYLKAIAAEGQLDYARLIEADQLTRLLDAAHLNQRQRVGVDLRWVAGAIALLGLALPFAHAVRAWRRPVVQLFGAGNAHVS